MMNLAGIFNRRKYELALAIIFFVIFSILLFGLLKSGLLITKKNEANRPVESGKPVTIETSASAKQQGFTDKIVSSNGPKASGATLLNNNSSQSSSQTITEFFIKEKRLLSSINSVKLTRVATVTQNSNKTFGETDTFLVKKDKVRVDMADFSVVRNIDGCFRIMKDGKTVYKYTTGQALENCRGYTEWNRISIDQVQANPETKSLGTNSFEGKSVTIVQVPILIRSDLFTMQLWFSNENGLTLFASGTVGNKEIKVEYGRFDFGNIDDGVFVVAGLNISESSEIF